MIVRHSYGRVGFVAVALLTLLPAHVGLAEVHAFGLATSVSEGGLDHYPAICVAPAGAIWLTWQDNIGSGGNGPSGIMKLVRSVDFGENFSFSTEPIDQAQDAEFSVPTCYPAIDTNESNDIYICWTCARDSVFEEGSYVSYVIYGNRMWNLSSWWSDDPRIADTKSQGDTVISSDIAVLSIKGALSVASHVFVVWSTNFSGNFDVYFDQSSNQMADMYNPGMDDDQRVDDTLCNSVAEDNRTHQDSPRIAVRRLGAGMSLSVPEVYIVWRDTREGGDPAASDTTRSDIYFTYGKDGLEGSEGVLAGEIEGATSPDNVGKREFIPDLRVNNRSHKVPSVAAQPDIDVDGTGNVYVVWRENRRQEDNYDIYFAKGSLNIASEGKPSFLFTEMPVAVNDDTGKAEQSHPRVAVNEDSGEIYIVWTDARNGDPDIYFTVVTDHGDETFTRGRNVQVNQAESEVVGGTKASKSNRKAASYSIQDSPDIDIDDAGNVYIVWRDCSGGSDNIHFTRYSVYDYDRRAPVAPEGLSAVAGGGAVDVAWTPNSESDLAGYNLYRREIEVSAGQEGTGEGEAKEGELNLSEDYILVAGCLTNAWYRDEDVEPGWMYAYVVLARDIAEKSSGMSEEVMTEEIQEVAAGGGGCFIATVVGCAPAGAELSAR